MIKIFKTEQIKDIDQQTISDQCITSFQLMKRAVNILFERILPLLGNNSKIWIFAGPGNNGGDALVLANKLRLIGCDLTIYLYNPKGKLSEDCQNAFNELLDKSVVININSPKDILTTFKPDIIIDGLFGSGLSRPLDENISSIITQINQIGSTIYSIDIPSGLHGENAPTTKANNIIRANITFTFQQPKLSFMFRESEDYIGELQILDIGISPSAIANNASSFFITEKKDISLKTRSKFGHKGSFGHAMIISGHYGMAGAAILASKACLHSGCGLLTIHVPNRLVDIMQISTPEAIVDIDDNPTCFSSARQALATKRYDAIGIGPGLGTEDITKYGVIDLLNLKKDNLVIDADALNIIAKNNLIDAIPAHTIITPHPKEFDRLCGESNSSKERLEKQIKLAKEKNIIVILKGAFSSIALPDGNVIFNPTGNDGMATGGSGDVLTGILTSLLAQHYSPTDAAILGVYIHGLAGDHAANKLGKVYMSAGDIVDNLSSAFKAIESN